MNVSNTLVVLGILFIVENTIFLALYFYYNEKLR